MGDAWCPSVSFGGKCSLSQPEPKNNLPADLLDVSKISAKLSRGGLLVNFGTKKSYTQKEDPRYFFPRWVAYLHPFWASKGDDKKTPFGADKKMAKALFLLHCSVNDNEGSNYNKNTLQ